MNVSLSIKANCFQVLKYVLLDCMSKNVSRTQETVAYAKRKLYACAELSI